MAVIHLLTLMICWCVVEVNSQLTFPYVSFRSHTLANHSYVNLSLVGYYSDSVQCHTDLSTCCSGHEGVHRGDWYSPGSTDRLPFSDEGGDIFEQRTAQRVELRRRNSATSPVGIYCCGIPTVAGYDDTDTSVRATVYVGLYTASGGMFILFTPLAQSLDRTKTLPLNSCTNTGGGVNPFARYASLIKFVEHVQNVNY